MSMSLNRKILRNAVRLLLLMALLGGLTVVFAGCSTEVSGTYKVSGGHETVSVSFQDGNTRGTTHIGEFILNEHGGVTADSSIGTFFSPPTGSYKTEGTRIEMSFGGEPLVGTIGNGKIVFDTTYGDDIVYTKVFFTANIVIPLVFIWLVIVVIQNFLSYGLIRRDVLREKEDGSGVTLFFTDLTYGFLALIPGLVIYLWLKERKKD